MRSTLVLVAALLATPSMASANGISNVSMTTEGDQAIVRVESLDALGKPWSRIDHGRVRVWFPRVTRDIRLERTGDGRLVESLRVRPGASDSAVVHIVLAPRVRLSPEAIAIEHDANGATIRVDLQGHAPAAAPTTAETVPSDPDAAGEPATALPAAAPKAAARPATAAGDPAAATALFATDAASGAATVDDGTSSADAKLGGGEAGASLGALLLASLVLGALYAGLRLGLLRRRRRPDLAGIEVLSAKRLGTKHQLLLVRALGEDHLLSVNGAQTERLASAPSPKEPQAADPIGGFLSRLPQDVVQLGASPEPKREEAATDKPEETPFGEELLSFVRGKPPSEPSAAPAGSDAVAGLMKLRERRAS